MCPELAVVPVSSDGPPVTSTPITMVPEVVFLWVTCILRVGGGVFVLHALRRAFCACLPWLGLGRGLRAIRFCHSPLWKGTSGPARLGTPRPALGSPPSLSGSWYLCPSEQECLRARMSARGDGPHLPVARNVGQRKLFAPRLLASHTPSLSASLTSGFGNTPRPSHPASEPPSHTGSRKGPLATGPSGGFADQPGPAPGQSRASEPHRASAPLRPTRPLSLTQLQLLEPSRRPTPEPGSPPPPGLSPRPGRFFKASRLIIQVPSQTWPPQRGLP